MTGAHPVTRIQAQAKLTLSLRVTGVREDGYHLIDSEMVTLDLADTLTITTASDNALRVEGDAGAVTDQVPSDRTNLVLRALTLAGRCAEVTLTKRIPTGGGLGGGSADAAAILRWVGYDDLVGASRLGADVPFCMAGGRARVRGIGERIEPLDWAGVDGQVFTLHTPRLHVSTPAVYRQWDLMGAPAGGECPNDLQAPALMVEPRLAEGRDLLRQATGLEPVLAGSGATWWVPGAFPGPERLVVRATQLAPVMPGVG